jgi:hypothetical protein
MNKLNLVLHTGGSTATREQINTVNVPQAEGRWCPIGHGALVDTVETELNKLGMRIITDSYGLANDGKRMFGVLQIANGHNSNDYSWIAGIRNSMDKTFPAGLCVGSAVFVCDNMAFSSEIVFGRRHTTNIMRDLPLLVARACGELATKWDTQGKRFDAYKKTELGNRDAKALLFDAFSANVFNTQQIRPVINEWLTPRHPEFKDRTVWSLFNAVTENLKPREASKGNSLWDLPARTTRLHAICDAACGLDFSDLKTVEPVALAA